MHPPIAPTRNGHHPPPKLIPPRSGLVQLADAPNTYPLARQVLGRFAPGTCRASGPG